MRKFGLSSVGDGVGLLRGRREENICFIIMVYCKLGTVYGSHYCFFGVKPSFKLGSEIKACKPPRNDLKSGQRHRHDLSV